MIENRGFRRQSRHRELGDVALQDAVVQQIAGDVVEPQTLTQIVKRLCWCHRVTSVNLRVRWCMGRLLVSFTRCCSKEHGRRVCRSTYCGGRGPEGRGASEHDQAQQSAWAGPGVLSVKNELTVRT